MSQIVILEDDPVVREYMVRCLSSKGYHVSSAENGEQALTSVRLTPTEVVVTDIRMPGMDGFDFVRALRRETGITQPDIIFVSSHEERDQFRQAMQLGGCDFLVKPFKCQELADTVNAAIKGRAARSSPSQLFGPLNTSEISSVPHLPGYEIIRLLGEGAGSQVFLAKHVKSGEQHALKAMKIGVADSTQREIINRFLAEYSMLARISHSNIARVYEHGISDHYLYIGMEYLPGGDLRLDIQGGISPKQASKRALEICAALGAIHKAGIVHRDLKPANILMRMTGEAVLADFGIAKQLTAGLDLTQQNIAVGTPYYMSPEQATASKVDARSDLYALGVLYFEMLAGRRPFPGSSATEVMAQHLHAAIPKLPMELARFQPVIDKLLAKKPVNRYASADEAHKAIQGLAT